MTGAQGIRVGGSMGGSRSHRSSGRPAPELPAVDGAQSWEALLLPVACGAVLLLALTFGGTREVLSPDAVVQIASLPLLGFALWQVPSIWTRGGSRLALCVLAAILALPLLQLIPLPPSIWTALPGRTDIVSAYQDAALPMPWLGISLNPGDTWRDLLTLIPPVAVFLSTLLLTQSARRILAAGVVVFAFVSVLLGLAQVAAGASEATGFFANRNHFAALLYAALPLTAAFAIGFASDRRREIYIVQALCLLIFASLLLGLGMARSRAGVGIAMLAGLASLALAVVNAET